MKTVLEKHRVGLIFIACILMIFTACSKPEDENQVKSNEFNNNNLAVTDNEEQEENLNPDEDGENELPDSENDKDKNIPNSKFFKSQMSMGRIIKSDTDISDIEKQILDTLSEFDAVEADDGEMLTLPEDILFDFDSYKLRTEADKAIKQLVQVIDSTDGDVTIVGHTDSHGEDDYNQKLSKNRAKAVLQALVEAGIKENRLISEGKGSTEPVAKNENSDGSDNPEGRQKNRRVEVTVHGFNQ